MRLLAAFEFLSGLMVLAGAYWIHSVIGLVWPSILLILIGNWGVVLGTYTWFSAPSRKNSKWL